MGPEGALMWLSVHLIERSVEAEHEQESSLQGQSMGFFRKLQKGVWSGKG
jgi:hypothetical protein